MLFIQAPVAQQVKQFSFKHFSTRDGLASNSIRCSLQDADGFIWIATSDGLQRYDGTRFITWRHANNNPRSIPANSIYQLMLDRQKRMWVLFENGKIGHFDLHRFRYHDVPVQVKDERFLRADKEMYHDLQGNIILLLKGTATLCYNARTDRFVPAGAALASPPGWKIFTVLADTASKRYWIGADSGLAVYDPLSGHLSYPGHNSDRNTLIEQHGRLSYVYNLFADRTRRLWFERWPPSQGAGLLYSAHLRTGRMLLNGYNFSFTINKYHEIRNLIQLKNGALWIKGLNVFGRFNESGNSFTLVENSSQSEQGISYDVVNDLHEDREQNVWVSTSNNGLFLFEPDHQLFTVVKHVERTRNEPGTGGVLSFLQANNGTILSGAWGNGLYRYDSAFNNLPVNIAGITEKLGYSIWNMHMLRDRRTIWMAMQPGIFIYDQLTNRARQYDPPILEHRTIRQVVEDSQGNVWLGLQNRGLFKWIRSKAEKEGFEKGFVKINLIANTNVNKIVVDREGFLWVTSVIDGVYRIDPVHDSTVEHLTATGPPNARLLDEVATTMMLYDDTTLIIAAGGLNIYNTRRKTMRHITLEDGLPSDVIVSIEKDNDRNLWMGMVNGLCRLNLATMRFSHYNRNDGLSNDEFDLAASYHLPDGRLLFGTIEDFVVFDPALVKSASVPPNPVITGLALTDNPLPLDSLLALSRIELPNYHNSVHIDFAGLSYRNKEKVSFYYMLDGLEKKWKRADEMHQATYGYLPPSNYTFRVKIVTADGLESKQTTLRIRIRPPFWRTWWFVSLLAFAALSLFLYMDRLRVLRLRSVIRMRTRIATNFAKDMGSTLGTINVLSEMARVKADVNPERTKEYVNQISDNSSRMMEVMDDMIFSIKPENDELQHTIARMSSFAADLHAKHDVEIHFELGDRVPDIRLRMDQRHELYAIFKEALTNAVRHSQAKYIDVTITRHKSRLRLRIQDEGKGFDTGALSFGRGLNDMQNKASGLHAKLSIQSEINTGTLVQLDMTI